MILADQDQAATRTLNFGDVTLEAGQTYYFFYRLGNSNILSFSDVKLRNENPDDPNILLDFVLDHSFPGRSEDTFQFIPDQIIEESIGLKSIICNRNSFH